VKAGHLFNRLWLYIGRPSAGHRTQLKCVFTYIPQKNVGLHVGLRLRGRPGITDVMQIHWSSIIHLSVRFDAIYLRL